MVRKSAQEMNVDDKREAAPIAVAKAQYATITSASGHDVLVLSSPEGAALVLYRGDERIGTCPATPCKFHFDAYYFDPRGGTFLFSKRALKPIQAQLGKHGYHSEPVTLTEGVGNWSESDPGGSYSFRYYYFERKVIPVPLRPL